MKFQLKPTIAALSAALVLTACGTINTQVREDLDQTQRSRKQVIEKPVQIAPISRVSEVRGALMPATAVASARKGEWLKQFSVQLEIKNTTPLSAVVAKLAEQGINIASDLPLDTYSYAGKINPTDAESALQAILGSVGLDYQVDDIRKLVVIKPLASRSWFLNIGNRKSTYSSDGQQPASSASNTSGTGSSGSGSASGTTGSSQSGTSSGASTGMTGSTGSTQSGASASGVVSPSATGTGVASADDFWSSLSTELGHRLSVMVPRSMLAPRQSGASTTPGLPGAQGGLQSPIPPQGVYQPGGNMAGGGVNTGDLYYKRQIGSFALNPETGAVTVQAPHWVLNDLDTYIKRIQDMYNTDITFMGELVLVTSNRSDSEGFDISAFGKWANNYGAVISNNALGGVTVTMPSPGGTPSVTAGAQAVAGPLMGLTFGNGINALNLFNAYLSEIGNVSVIQRPLVTTTSGVPGVFSKKITDYYNTVSQQAASGGTGSAATATQNVLVPVELGTELRINPRIDISTGMIRAQLTLNQVIKSGTKTVPQTITFGNNTTTVNTTIPIITKQNLSGEILLRDGDMIVVGGQTEDNMTADENGLPGQNGPLGGILGVKKASRGAQTYYFALRVSVNKRQ